VLNWNVIYAGDAKILGTEIGDESVDIIFTDPPYLREYLGLYEWLAGFAERVLRVDGFLLVYAGGYWKDVVMQSLGARLQYFWDYTLLMGNASIMWPRRVVAKGKSLLAYHKKGQGPLPRVATLGVWGYSRMDKTLHDWGQDEETARYYLDCFSYPGYSVLDPFCGAGTTCIVAKMLGLDWMGFDIDPDAVQLAKERVAGFTQTRAQPFLIDMTQLAMLDS